MYDKTHYNKKKKKKENTSKFERSKINLCLQMEKKKFVQLFLLRQLINS